VISKGVGGVDSLGDSDLHAAVESIRVDLSFLSLRIPTLDVKAILPLWREPTFWAKQSRSLFLLDISRLADETKHPQPYPTQTVGSQWFD
jgi:hypothetical protein